MSVARFHRTALDALAGCGVDVAVSTRPSEIADTVAFAEDMAPRPHMTRGGPDMSVAVAQANAFHRVARRGDLLVDRLGESVIRRPIASARSASTGKSMTCRPQRNARAGRRAAPHGQTGPDR